MKRELLDFLNTARNNSQTKSGVVPEFCRIDPKIVTAKKLKGPNNTI